MWLNREDTVGKECGECVDNFRKSGLSLCRILYQENGIGSWDNLGKKWRCACFLLAVGRCVQSTTIDWNRTNHSIALEYPEEKSKAKFKNGHNAIFRLGTKAISLDRKCSPSRTSTLESRSWGYSHLRRSFQTRAPQGAFVAISVVAPKP